MEHEQGHQESQGRWSRRELLAGAAGALSVVAAESLAKMPSARANDGDSLLVGKENYAQSTTKVYLNASTPTDGLYIEGWEGGDAVKAIGGSSQTYPGGRGVYGTGGSPNGAGVYGAGDGNGPGLQGVGGSSNGNGVEGSGYIGVRGQGDSGYGLVGISANNVGVHAQTSSGIALETQGRVVFSQAGVATVGAGKTFVKVLLDETKFLGSSSFIVATLQALRTGVWVSAVVPNVVNHSFKIYLNQAVLQATKVGWFIVG